MKRIGVMAATAMIALLLALPLGLVMAQDGNSGNVARQPPLFGTAMADGFPVPPGTMIVAMVGDEKVGSTEVMALKACLVGPVRTTCHDHDAAGAPSDGR